MAEEKPTAPAGSPILEGKKSRSHNVVASWGDCPLVPPEILREWLEQRVGEVNVSCEAILNDVECLKQAENEEKLRAASTLSNSKQFVYLANRAAPLLREDVDPSVSIAFTAGLRLGMVYENLLSLADGRYYEKWLREESRQRAGEATKELTSESDVLLLKNTYAKYRGQVKAYDKTANELFERHGIKSRRGKKISAKTIKRRLAELEILDNA